MEIFVVKAEATPWHEEGRLQGNLDIPLSPKGVRGAERTGDDLAQRGVKRVFSGFTLPAYQTACILCDRDELRSVNRRADLDEVNMGLWQGLWKIDIKRKHRRAYLQWLRNPASVEPPMGERLDEAYDRLVAGLEDILKAHMRSRIVTVVGPYAYALMACYLRDRGLDHFWEMFNAPKKWEMFTV